MSMKASYQTRAGSTVILHSENALGSRPLVGAYFSGEEWIPCSWLPNGSYIEGEQKALDIIDYK